MGIAWNPYIGILFFLWAVGCFAVPVMMVLASCWTYDRIAPLGTRSARVIVTGLAAAIGTAGVVGLILGAMLVPAAWWLFGS